MYAQTLHFGEDALEPVLTDADFTLQRLLRNMIAKNSMAGTLNIRIDIELIPDQIENYDPAIAGNTRKILIPKLSHKIGSVMQIKDESKGSRKYDGYELALDEERGEYVLKPLDTAQQSIFDGDYQSRKTASLPTHVPDEESGDSPFERMKRFVGIDMRVCEAMGNYTLRAKRNSIASQEVVLSSAFPPDDPFFCAAERLKAHVGHTALCTLDNQNGKDFAMVVCKECGEALFRMWDIQNSMASEMGASTDEDTSSPVDGEMEDISEVFGSSPYEPPEK